MRAQLLSLNVCCPGVYTAYKPYLNKDEEIIKQLQKVSSSSLMLTRVNDVTHYVMCLWLFLFLLSSGCSTEKTIGSSECNPSPLLPGTDPELHYSSGDAQ